MRLRDIEANPAQALNYLDRYVNDGSPSGFTERYRTSPLTDPFSLNRDFRLRILRGREQDFETYGTIPSHIPLNSTEFFVHPDMVTHPELKGFDLSEQTLFSVVPTSSCRTVRILSSECADYIKLHYDSIIGRVNRKLNYRKAANGVQLSYVIRKAIDENKISAQLCLLQEPFARVHINPSIQCKSDYWCFIWRDERPFGRDSAKIAYQIPLFALWSTDRINPTSRLLFSELKSKWGGKARDVLSQNLLESLLQIYFDLILNLGLQNELNAQNILIGFDENWFPISIIIKDLMGIEKDLTLMSQFGLQTKFDSDYKDIFEGMRGEDNLYQKRHSLSFDFKFCHYIIKPLIELGCNSELFSESEIKTHLKNMTRQYLRKLPENYLSRDVWFDHDRKLLANESRRRYRKQTKPFLR